jgi:hypothetical protein
MVKDLKVENWINGIGLLKYCFFFIIINVSVWIRLHVSQLIL